MLAALTPRVVCNGQLPQALNQVPSSRISPTCSWDPLTNSKTPWVTPRPPLRGCSRGLYPCWKFLLLAPAYHVCWPLGSGVSCQCVTPHIADLFSTTGEAPLPPSPSGSQLMNEYMN